MPNTSADPFAGDSDSEPEFKTQNEYAKNYDTWRKKEELNKLKTQYGDDVLGASESSSSSEDDEDAAELTEEVEKDFYRTLSYLKSKDPKIYDSSKVFFKESTEVPQKIKKKKDRPMFLKDYERKLILERGGELSDEEDQPQTYAKEQQGLKDDIKWAALEESDEDENELLLKPRKKTDKEEEKEAELFKWLAGKSDVLKDQEIKTELKPLKEFWSDPNLDSGEGFLRDYIVNKRYLDKDEGNYIPTYDEVIHDSDESLSGDEEHIEKQEEFEHKYNFRFEEPDQEFIKRYPRTIDHSLRKTDDRRKLKRAETKERKQKEKEQKMADIRKLQELKKKEIEEKLEKLREVTGAADLNFEDEDIDGDFDPDAYDKKMQQLFNDEFYEGQETDQKPEFPDLDKELEIENWDRWDGNDDFSADTTEDQGPHCEDEDFNMDADFNPSTSNTVDELIENSRGRKKRKRKSKVAEALSRPKPKFDPNDKNYEKYFEEYYKLECEDVIGDLPCSFKYREVVPNDFGLSIEEILLAKDKELNRWCSLKKTVQRRPELVEKYEQFAYAKKGSNLMLKKKLLPSLFGGEEEDKKQNVEEKSLKSEDQKPETQEVPEEVQEEKLEVKKSKKKKKKKKNKRQQIMKGDSVTGNPDSKEPIKSTGGTVKGEYSEVKNSNKAKIDTKSKKDGSDLQNCAIKSKKTKRKMAGSDNNKHGGKRAKESLNVGMSDARLIAYGINPKKYKNKLKYGKQQKN